jgi:PAS domain S-box-containing protein
MFEASPICTSVTRLSDSVCIDANDAFLRTFGYERDEVVGEDSSTLDLWVDHSLRDRIMAAVHEDGTVAGFEAFFHTKEDTVRALFLVGALVEIAGEPCALMFGVDITGLKSAQERAAVREAQLRTAIDCAPFGSHTYRLDPDDRLVFVGYNRKAEEILGIDHAALVGQTLEQAFPGNAGTETAVAYRMVAREGSLTSTPTIARASRACSSCMPSRPAT